MPLWKAASSSVTGSGEANTASNVGTSGSNVFKQKSALDLEFRKVFGSLGITSSIDPTGDYVDIHMDINSLTEDATPAADTDYVATYDADAGTIKKVSLSKLSGSGGGGGSVNNLQDAYGGGNSITVDELRDITIFHSGNEVADTSQIVFHGLVLSASEPATSDREREAPSLTFKSNTWNGTTGRSQLLTQRIAPICYSHNSNLKGGLGIFMEEDSQTASNRCVVRFGYRGSGPGDIGAEFFGASDEQCLWVETSTSTSGSYLNSTTIPSTTNGGGFGPSSTGMNMFCEGTRMFIFASNLIRPEVEFGPFSDSAILGSSGRLWSSLYLKDSDSLNVGGTIRHPFNDEGFMYVTSGSTAVSGIADIGTDDTLFTAFSGSAGSNGTSSGMTVDAANNRVTMTKTAKYRVTFNLSFDGTASTVYTFTARLGGVLLPGAVARSFTDASGFGMPCSFSTIMDNAIASQNLQIYQKADGASKTITVYEATLSITGVATT